MKLLLALVALMLAIGCDSVHTSVSGGTQLLINEVQESVQLYEGELYQHRFDDIPFEFSSQVFERDHSLDSGVNEDYESNLVRRTSTYQTSDLCRIKRSAIDFYKLAETAYFPNAVQAYLFDGDYGIYLLSGKWLTFHVVGTVESSVQLKKYAEVTLDKEFGEEDAYFLRVEGTVYISDGKALKRITIDEQSRIITQQTVSGFQPLTEDSKLVKLVKGTGKGEFYVLGTSSLSLYTLVDLDTVKPKDGVPAGMATGANTFKDLVVEGERVCVLDFLKGVYIFNSSDAATFRNYELNFGSTESMEMVGNTLQIIFRYHKTFFVGEFLVRSDSLELNRFYEQISGFKDIDFYNEMGIFVGEDELLVIEHSVNRNFLLEIEKQHMKTFPAYGMLNFEVMPKHSDSQNIMMMGVSNYGALVVRMELSRPLLLCNFKNAAIATHTFLAEFNTSSCGSFTWQQFQQQSSKGDRYCRTRKAFQVNVKRPFERKVSNLFSTALFLVVVISIMLLIGAAAKWKFSMNSLIVRLRNELRRKQTLLSSKGSSVNVLNRP